MLLSHTALTIIVERGVVTNVQDNQINATSIDITLGDTILSEIVAPEDDSPVVYLKNRDQLKMKEHKLSTPDDVFYLMPGQFILAQSEQKFFLPNNISAEYKLKSSMARCGLEHLNAGWCDAGWNNSVLTLELKNMTQDHIIALQRGVGIGQMVFFMHEPVPDSKSYAARGRYNNDDKATGVKL